MKRFLLLLAMIFVGVGCATDRRTPQDQAFLQTPAAVRVAFEAQHPAARVSDVRKVAMPGGTVRWIITYRENGQVETAQYDSSGEGVKAGAPSGQ